MLKTKIKMVEKLFSGKIGVTRNRLYCLLENRESGYRQIATDLKDDIFFLVEKLV